jgi:YebC/PmpR family DNA-binding regulatory protein
VAGHSHWAGIKYKKGAADAKRGKLFSKLASRIMLAAREGGGDVSMNLKLRYAMDQAKAANMPKDRIARAVKKGTGELAGTTMSEIIYEGYGQGGVAIIVEALTDNRNRTVAAVRKIFQLRGGNMGETGCVSWMFSTKGLIQIEDDKITEDELLEIALEAGAEDIKHEGSVFEVITRPGDFEAVKQAIEARGIAPSMGEITRIPSSSVPVDESTGRKVIGLISALEDLDDVVNVYANYDIADEVMAKLLAEADSIR